MQGNLPRSPIDTGHSITVEEAVLPVAASEPGRMGIARFVIAAGEASVPERHESHEVWLVESGTGAVTYRGATFSIGSGAMAYFEPWHDHSVRNTSPMPLAVFSVWWKR